MKCKICAILIGLLVVSMGIFAAVNLSAGSEWTSFWNNAIASLTPNRTWKEKIVITGYWTLTSEAVVPSYTIVEIQGTVKLADWSGTQMSMFNLAGNHDIEIRGGEIDGNRLRQVKGNTDEYQDGIYGINAQDVFIEDVYVHDCVYSGILFSHRNINGVDTGASRITISHCKLGDCGYGAIHFHLGIDCKVENNRIINKAYVGPRDGIYFYQSSRAVISGNTIVKPAGRGIYLFQTDHSTVTGNIINSTNQDGIGLTDSKFNTLGYNVITLSEADGISLTSSMDNTIGNNIITDSAHGARNYSSGVSLTSGSAYNTIESNIIVSSYQRYGYTEESANDNFNRVFANTFYGYQTAPTHQMGPNSSIYQNTLIVQTGGKVNTVIVFSFSPNPASPSQQVTLSGTLEDVSTNPVYPAQVKVEYSTDGGASWNPFTNLNTNSAGQFSVSFGAPGAGSYLARVSYAGSASYNPSSSTQTLVVS